MVPKRLKLKTAIVKEILENEPDVSVVEIAKRLYGVGKAGRKTRKRCYRLLEYVKARAK